MSERDQFEARAAEKLRLPIKLIQSARDGDRYLHAFDSMNVMQPLNGWWGWWQASREALKAEQEGDSELLASAKKLEREVGDIVERLNQLAGDGFMCVPVADLYELQNKDGSAYCFSTSSSEAHEWVKEGYTIQEYVTLERLQDTVNQPDGDAWIACSERMPDEGNDADGNAIGSLVLYEAGKEPNGGFNVGVWNNTYMHKWWRGYITHWMPIPAPPSQPHPIDTTSQQYEKLAKGE